MFLELIKGVALLLALCFLHGVNIRLWRQKPLVGQIVSGVLFGGICVVGMLMPLVLMPGVIFDARSVVLCMAGLFGGPVVAIIAGTLTMAWRLWLGGAGMGVGLLVVVICVSLGLLYRYARQRGKLDVGPRTPCCFSDWWCMWRWWGRFSFCLRRLCSASMRWWPCPSSPFSRWPPCCWAPR